MNYNVPLNGIEKQISLWEFIQRIWDREGIRIEDISIEWWDVSQTGERNFLIKKIRITNDKFFS